jgi:hypothetical protein
MAFRRKASDTTSKYRGVAWSTRLQKWSSQICPHNKKKHLGVFTDEADAARAYDRAARSYFKAFAQLNFPNDKAYF